MVRENIENLNNEIESKGNSLDISYVGATEKEVSKKIDKILEDLERSNKQLEEIFDKKKIKDDIESVISRSNEDIDKKWLAFKEVLNKIMKALEKENLGDRLISKTKAGGEALSESYSSGEKDLERIRKILGENNNSGEEKNVSEPKPEPDPLPSSKPKPKPKQKAKAKKRTDKKSKVKKGAVANKKEAKNENIEKLREEFLDYAGKIKSMSKTIRKNREKLGNEAADIDLILEDVEELEKNINSGEERELNTLRNNIKTKFELVGKKSDIRSLAIDIANSELSVALKDEAKKIEKDSISVMDLYGLNKVKNELKKIKEDAKNDNPSRGLEEKIGSGEKNENQNDNEGKKEREKDSEKIKDEIKIAKHELSVTESILAKMSNKFGKERLREEIVRRINSFKKEIDRLHVELGLLEGKIIEEIKPKKGNEIKIVKVITNGDRTIVAKNDFRKGELKSAKQGKSFVLMTKPENKLFKSSEIEEMRDCNFDSSQFFLIKTKSGVYRMEFIDEGAENNQDEESIEDDEVVKEKKQGEKFDPSASQEYSQEDIKIFKIFNLARKVLKSAENNQEILDETRAIIDKVEKEKLEIKKLEKILLRLEEIEKEINNVNSGSESPGTDDVDTVKKEQNIGDSEIEDIDNKKNNEAEKDDDGGIKKSVEDSKNQDNNKEVEEGFVIKLGEDEKIEKALEHKLQEYKERLVVEREDTSYGEYADLADTVYRIAILEKLLDKGEVDAHKISGELKKTNDNFYQEIFNESFSIIKDYSETGGSNLYNGTGLKFEDEEKRDKNNNEEIIENKEGDGKSRDEKNEDNSSLESRQEFFDGFYDDTEEKVYELKNVALRDDYLERLQELKDKYDDFSEADVEDLWQLRTEIYDVYAAENKDFEKRKSVHEVLGEIGATVSAEDLDDEKNYKGMLENNKVELDEAVKEELGRLLMEYNIIDGEEGSGGKMEEIYENLKSGLDEALEGEVEREFSKLRHHKEKLVAGVGVAGISALASAGMRLVGGGLVSGSLIAGGAALGAGSGLLRSKIRKFLSPKMKNIKAKEGERYEKIREEKAQEVLNEENIKLLLLQSLKSEIAKKAAGEVDCSVEDYRDNVEEFFNANNSELAGSLSAKKREAVLDSLAVFSKITNENSGKLAGSIEPKSGKWAKINESAKSAAIGGVFGAVSGTARSISETAAAASLSSGLFGGVISGAMMSGKIEEMMKKHDIKKIQEEADSLVQKIKSGESGDYNFHGDLRQAQVLLESGVLDKSPLVREKLRNSLSERLADLIKLEKKEIEVLDSKTGKDTVMEDLKKRIEKGNLRKWKAWAAGIGGGMVIGTGTALAFSISGLGGEGNGNNSGGNNPPPPPFENINPNDQFPDDIGGQVSALGLDDYIESKGIIDKTSAFEKTLSEKDFRRLLVWKESLEKKASDNLSLEEINKIVYEIAKDGYISDNELDPNYIKSLLGKDVTGEMSALESKVPEEEILQQQTKELGLAENRLRKSIEPDVLDKINKLGVSKNTLELFAKDGSIDSNDLKIYEEAPLGIKGNEKLFGEFFDSVRGKEGVRLETIKPGGSISEALGHVVNHEVKVINPDGTILENFDQNLVHEGDTIVDVNGDIIVFKTSDVSVKEGQSLEGIYDKIDEELDRDNIPEEVRNRFNSDKGEGEFHDRMNRTEAKNAREFWNGLGKERQEVWEHLSNDHKGEILKKGEWVSSWKEQNPHLGNQEWLYIEDKNNLGLRASAIDNEGNDGVPDVVKIFSGDKTIETIERNQGENGEEFLIRTENSIKDTIKTKNNEIYSIIDDYKIKPQDIKEAGINFFDKNFADKMKVWGENQDGIFESKRIVKSFFISADRFGVDYKDPKLIDFLNQNSKFQEDLLDIEYMEKAMQSFKYIEEHPTSGITAKEMLDNFEQLSVFQNSPEQLQGMFSLIKDGVKEENVSKLFEVQDHSKFEKKANGIFVLKDASIGEKGYKADILLSIKDGKNIKFGFDGPGRVNSGTTGFGWGIKPDTDLISGGQENIGDLKNEFVEKMKALKDSHAQEAANRQEGR